MIDFAFPFVPILSYVLLHPFFQSSLVSFMWGAVSIRNVFRQNHLSTICLSLQHSPCTPLVPKSDNCAPQACHIHTCISQEAITIQGHVLFYLIKSLQRPIVFVPTVKIRTIKCPCQGNGGVFVLFC